MITYDEDDISKPIIGINRINKPLDKSRNWEEYCKLYVSDNDTNLVEAFEYCNESDIWTFIHVISDPLYVSIIEINKESEIIECDDGNITSWKTDCINVLSTIGFSEYLNQSPLRQQEAISANPRVIEYIIHPTNDLCKIAVESDGSNIRFIQNQTPELCWLSVNQSEYNLQYIKPEYQFDDLCLKVVSINGDMLKHVAHKTFEICYSAITQDGFAIEYVENQTEELCLVAIRKKAHAIKKIRNPTIEMCKIVLLLNPGTVLSIPSKLLEQITRRWNPCTQRYEII
jgi:hypothetical protein